MTTEPLNSRKDEQALMDKVANGSQAALESVLRIFGPKLMGYLSSRFGDSMDYLEINGVFNLVASKIWSRANQFNGCEGRLSSWLIRMAQTTAIDYLRGRKTFEPLPPDVCQFHPIDSIDDTDTIEYQRAKALRAFIENDLIGFEKIVATNDYKSGGEADAARLAELHNKSVNQVYVTRSRVKSKLSTWLRNWETRNAYERSKK